MEHREDELEREARRGQDPMEQARDRAGSEGPMEQARNEEERRADDTQGQPRRARRNTRDTLSLEEARKRDRGLG